MYEAKANSRKIDHKKLDQALEIKARNDAYIDYMRVHIRDAVQDALPDDLWRYVRVEFGAHTSAMKRMAREELMKNGPDDYTIY